MDRSTAQAWLDAYIEAWKTYDPAQVEALFAEDVTYRYHPYDTGEDVLHGRDAVVSSWVEPDGSNVTQLQFAVDLNFVPSQADPLVYVPEPAPYELAVDDVTFY